MNPLTASTAKRYHGTGVYIFIHRDKTVAVSAPAPAAWIEIFHQKLIIDNTIDSTAVAKMKDFRKNGI